MPAYVIAQMRVDDAKVYREYALKVAPTIAPFGGRLLVASDDADVLEGQQPFPRIVIGEFPTVADAKAWYASEAYQAIQPLRAGSTTGAVFIVEGVSLADRVAPGGERPN
jgi:uncharacterized protein (DUF1330 family)